MQFKAFELGIIDDEGKVLRKFKTVKGSERKHYTMLHRFVFNLKRILKYCKQLLCILLTSVDGDAMSATELMNVRI